jgi:hypothetical protein
MCRLILITTLQFFFKNQQHLNLGTGALESKGINFVCFVLYFGSTSSSSHQGHSEPIKNLVVFNLPIKIKLVPAKFQTQQLIFEARARGTAKSSKEKSSKIIAKLKLFKPSQMSEEEIPLNDDDIAEEIEIESEEEDEEDDGDGSDGSSNRSTDGSDAEEEFVPEREDAKIIFQEHKGNITISSFFNHVIILKIQSMAYVIM